MHVQSQLLALYCLSEIGWLTDILSVHRTALDTVVSLFANPSEDIKMAAAFALGGLCVGNPTHGLGVLLGSLSGSTSNTYLLLTALKVGPVCPGARVVCVCMFRREGAFVCACMSTRVCARVNVGVYVCDHSLLLTRCGHLFLCVVSAQEVVSRHKPANPAGPDFSGHVDEVLPILASFCEVGEEGVRNMVAECLGAYPCALMCVCGEASCVWG